MSLRAEALRLGARYLIKPRGGRAIDVADRRRQSAIFARLVPKPPPDIETLVVDAGGVPADLISAGAGEGERHILFVHGGGFVIGSPALYRDFTWRLARAADARVLAIDYRLAPEHPFPAALDDAAAAYRWLLARCAGSRSLAVIGDSAGGGLALALLLRLRDEGMDLPAAAAAVSPWTDLALTGASLRRNAAADPIVNADEVPRFAAYYLGGADPRQPYASPLYGDPTGLPPTLIQVGSDEVLLDDAVRMVERMRAAGCEVALEVWPRMPHVWHTFAPVLPEARDAIRRLGAFVRSRTRYDIDPGAAPPVTRLAPII
jgi:epsilon-lactone hydrolase